MYMRMRTFLRVSQLWMPVSEAKRDLQMLRAQCKEVMMISFNTIKNITTVLATSCVFFLATSSSLSNMHSSPADSVVRVAGYSACGSGVGNGSGIRQGSGFVIDRGVVITDAHVIYGDKHVMVQARGKYYPATVVVFSRTEDLAVLRTTAPLPAPLGLSQEPRGTRGVLTGYPVHSSKLTLPATITGTITDTQTGITRTLLVVHTDGRKGESGGPFLTGTGKVAGMFELYWPGKSTGYFITVPVIKEILKDASGKTEPVSTKGCGPIK